MTKEEREWKILFRRRLKNMLYERNITQLELAKRSGIDQSRISKYCLGKKIPTIYTAVRIAKALNCSLEDLCGI